MVGVWRITSEGDPSSVAVIASEGLPVSLNIVTLDERLAGAGRCEGFIVQAVSLAS